MNPYLTTSEPKTEPRPACEGQWWLFDSTEPEDHRAAQLLCSTCPVFQRCIKDLAQMKRETHPKSAGPVGTWAGILLGPRHKKTSTTTDTAA